GSENRPLAGGDMASQMVQQKQNAPLLSLGGRRKNRVHQTGAADAGFFGKPGRTPSGECHLERPGRLERFDAPVGVWIPGVFHGSGGEKGASLRLGPGGGG